MPALPGKRPQVHVWKMFRSTGGAMHLDFGKTGLITKPGAKGALLLDNVKREARMVPPVHAQAAAPPATAPGGAMPHTPKPPALPNVKDLGKRIIGGHPAEGKMYTFHPPKVPGLPQPGKAPAGPKIPAMAKPPIPSAPRAKVQTLEVWTHTQLKVPLLTKASGISGLQSSICKNAKGGEPPASLFRIPPGYKLVEPKPPTPAPSPA